MTFGPIGDSLLAMPSWGKWTLAMLGVTIGLAMILWPDRIIRRLRKWLLFQLRLIRRPGYRRMLKAYGWLLFVTGALLTALLIVMHGG